MANYLSQIWLLFSAAFGIFTQWQGFMINNQEIHINITSGHSSQVKLLLCVQGCSIVMEVQEYFGCAKYAGKKYDWVIATYDICGPVNAISALPSHWSSCFSLMDKTYSPPAGASQLQEFKFIRPSVDADWNLYTCYLLFPTPARGPRGTPRTNVNEGWRCWIMLSCMVMI